MNDDLFILRASTGEIVPFPQNLFTKISRSLPSASLSTLGYEASKEKRVRMSRIDNGVFVHTAVSDSQLFMPDVQAADVARLVRLVCRINWLGDLPAKTFDTDFIQGELDINKSSAYQFIKFLKEYFGEDLKSIEDNLNSVFFKGSPDNFEDKSKEIRFVRVYVKSYAEAYNYTGLYNRSSLGCLIKLIPFMNVNSGILCHNTRAVRESKSLPLDTDDIVELLGGNRKHLRERVLPAWHKILISTNGEMQPIVKNIRGMYVVNPALMSAAKYDAAVWELFLNKKINEEDE